MSGELIALSPPDPAETYGRYQVFKQRIDEAHRLAWIGGLVALFSNEELRLLADRFCIWETLELRRLGLLRPDEGYDGTKRPKRPRNGRTEP